jgi:hypothetical protein
MPGSFPGRVSGSANNPTGERPTLPDLLRLPRLPRPIPPGEESTTPHLPPTAPVC